MDKSRVEMSPEEEAKLLEAGKEISATLNSPWQPMVVARAFRGRPSRIGPYMLNPLTMIGWLDLDTLRSPFLHGERPKDPEVLLRAVVDAVGVLADETVTVEDFSLRVAVHEATDAWRVVELVVRAAFSTAVKMAPKDRTVGLVEPGGFGNWLSVYTALRKMGIPRAEARVTPVAEAFAVTACALHQTGKFEVDGIPYNAREAWIF